MGLSGRRLTLTLATLLGVLLVVGAAAAFAVGRAQRLAGQTTTTSSPGPSLPASGASSATTGAGAGTGGAGSDAGADTSTGAGSGSSAIGSQSRRPAVEPGSGATPPPSTNGPTETTETTEGVSPRPSQAAPEPVAITMSARAATSPYAQQISGLLMRYFTAINRHDYDAWLATVSTGQAKQDREHWITSYSTTHDSDVYVSDIIQRSDALLVRMQFVSHQSVELAPTALPEPCVRWDVTYQIVDEGPGLRVGTSAEAPSLAPCT